MHTALLTYRLKGVHRQPDMSEGLDDLDVASLVMYTLHPWHRHMEWEHFAISLAGGKNGKGPAAASRNPA